MRAIEVADAFKFRHPAQLAFEVVGPSVIRATQVLRFTAGFVHHRHRVVAANIEECAQLVVAPADHDDGLARHRGSEVLPGFIHLVRASHRLPGAREHVFTFERRYARVGIPRRRNRVGLG